MSISFTKMSGAGNDFVVIDNRGGEIEASAEFVAKVCSRRVSVGADGLLLAESPHDPSEADFRMRYFNADGGEAETCGNGARCIARFAFLNGIAEEKMHFETLAGVYSAEMTGENVLLGLGDPRDIRLDFPLELTEGEAVASFANTGVPHAVRFMDEIDSIDVQTAGREMRYHKAFGQAGANANFVRVEGEQRLRTRTYERGVEDETLACGTGAVASAVTAALRGKARPPVTVRVQGGFDLIVHFELNGGAASGIRLEGDARVVFTGELSEEAWSY